MTSREAARVLLQCTYKTDIKEDDFLDAICLAIYALMKQEEQHGKHEENDTPENKWYRTEFAEPYCSGIYWAQRKGRPHEMFVVKFVGGKWYIVENLEEIFDVTEWKEYQ